MVREYAGELQLGHLLRSESGTTPIVVYGHGGNMLPQEDSGITGKTELEIFAHLRKILNAVDIYAAKLKEKTGLNASQLSCLMVLKSENALPLSKLSKKVSLSPSMITAIVDQLEKKKMVTRLRNSADRRIIMIELTESGRSVVETAPPSFQEQFMRSLSILEHEQKRFINETLEKLLSIIASDVLIDSPMMGAENKLVEVAASALRTEEV